MTQNANSSSEHRYRACSRKPAEAGRNFEIIVAQCGRGGRGSGPGRYFTTADRSERAGPFHENRAATFGRTSRLRGGLQNG